LTLCNGREYTHDSDQVDMKFTIILMAEGKGSEIQGLGQVE
jgi:hypothetical protein